MAKSRKHSESSPLARPDVARKAAMVSIRATAMGLVPPKEEGATVDLPSLRRVLEYVYQAGIGRSLVREVAVVEDTETLSRLLDDLETAMVDSPVPEREWPSLEAVFGPEKLAALLGISASSLRRYLAGARDTPDAVAARLHFLALVVGDLAGSYNDIGIRRWFDRERVQLDGRAPSDLLSGPWDPGDTEPRRVRALAAALLSPFTT